VTAPNSQWQPQRWKRLVGWYLLFLGVSGAGRLILTGETNGPTVTISALCFALGGFWVVNNPPPKGYFLVGLWERLTVGVRLLLSSIASWFK
jgi:hypothetical protein